MCWFQLGVQKLSPSLLHQLNSPGNSLTSLALSSTKYVYPITRDIRAKDDRGFGWKQQTDRRGSNTIQCSQQQQTRESNSSTNIRRRIDRRTYKTIVRRERERACQETYSMNANVRTVSTLENRQTKISRFCLMSHHVCLPVYFSLGNES